MHSLKWAFAHIKSPAAKVIRSKYTVLINF